MAVIDLADKYGLRVWCSGCGGTHQTRAAHEKCMAAARTAGTDFGAMRKKSDGTWPERKIKRTRKRKTDNDN